ALADLAEARKGDGAGVPGLDAGLGIAEQAIRNSAQARIRVLERRKASDGASGPPAPAGATDDAVADTNPGADAVDEGADASTASPPDDGGTAGKRDGDDDYTLSFNGDPWDAETNPLTVSWWPDFANRWLNAQVGRGQKNIQRMRPAQDALKNAYLCAMPATQFVQLALFALMLMIAFDL